MLQIPYNPQYDFSHAVAQIRAELLQQKVDVQLPAPRTLTKEEWPPNYEQVLAWRQRQLALFELRPELIEGAKLFYQHHPAEFINHWCDTIDPRNIAVGKPVRLPLVLFQRQKEFIEFLLACLRGEEGGLAEKSRDMGATWVSVAFSVWLFLFWPGAAVGWGSATAPKVDRIGDASSIFEKIRSLIRALPLFFLPKGFRFADHLLYTRCINPETDASITGEIGDNIGRGGRTLIYFVDEAAHLEHPQMVEASLMDTTRVRIDISSVSGLGTVFHRKREAGELWEPGTDVKKGVTNIFIMDWRDHPEKTDEWYNRRKTKAENEGNFAQFAQEIDRDYAGAVEGVIIRSEWVKAAIDAHKKLGLDEDGPWGAALDVADSEAGTSGDRNALAKRQGVILRHAEEWGDRDVGQAARRAVAACGPHAPIEVQYDSSPIASGVKAEINRLRDENDMPRGVVFVPWNAASTVINPQERIIPDDPESPLNKNFYANLKAQGWWELRGRFFRTYQAVVHGIEHHPDTLISIDSSLKLLRQIEKELCQPTAGRNTTLKLIVNKAPEGARSPNIGDAIMMAYWPRSTLQPQIATGLPVFLR